MVITFDRIGRNHNPPTLTLGDTHTLNTEDDIVVVGGEIVAHARKHLTSRDVDVFVDADTLTGWIIIGMVHSGGNFTITV